MELRELGLIESLLRRSLSSSKEQGKYARSRYDSDRRTKVTNGRFLKSLNQITQSHDIQRISDVRPSATIHLLLHNHGFLDDIFS